MTDCKLARRVVATVFVRPKSSTTCASRPAVVNQCDHVAIAIHDVRELAGGGRAVERIEFPDARIGEREPEDTVGERAFAEKFRAGVNAIGLELIRVRATGAVVYHDIAAEWLDVDIVGKRPAVAEAPGGRCGVVGARPDEIRPRPGMAMSTSLS